MYYQVNVLIFLRYRFLRTVYFAELLVILIFCWVNSYFPWILTLEPSGFNIYTVKKDCEIYIKTM